MLFDIDTNDKDAINTAIEHLKELKKDLKKIHVGDTVKVIDTGMMCTTDYTFFQDEIRQYDKNDAMFSKLIELSSRYDYGTSWYEVGIKSLKDEFRVEYISELKTLAVITTSANSYYRKSYLIEFSGLKKC